MASAHKTTSDVEHEVEQTRSQVANTLDELRHKMAPGALADSMVSYATDNGGADFLRTLGNQVRANPLPVTLIGAGIAWLAMSSNRPTNGSTTGRYSPSRDSASHTGDGSLYRSSPSLSPSGYEGSSGDSGPGMMQRASSSVSDTASSVSGSVSNIAQSVRSTAGSIADSVQRTYGGVTRRAQNLGSQMSDGVTAASGGMRSGYERTGSLASKLTEQPLVTLALGVAVGAAIGAALPATQAENEYLGPTSDALKERAQDMASDQYSNLKETASQTMEAVKSEAKAQGLTGDGSGDAKSGLGDKLGAIAGAAKTAMNEGVDRSSESLSSKTRELSGSSSSTAKS
jgi:hypothetical protein